MQTIPLVDLGLPPDEVAALVHDACRSVGFFNGVSQALPLLFAARSGTMWQLGCCVSTMAVGPLQTFKHPSSKRIHAAQDVDFSYLIF
jgi:hypothetical protein